MNAICPIVGFSLVLFGPLSRLDAQRPPKPSKELSTSKRLDHVKKLEKSGKEATKEEIAALTAYLKDKTPEVRSAAVNGLASVLYVQKQSCPLDLVRTLLDPDAGVRGSASAVVGIFDRYPENTLPLLLKAMQDEDVTVRSNVTWMLYQWGENPQVVAALKKAMLDRKWLVRNNAGIALGKILDDVSIQLPCWLEAIGKCENDITAKESLIDKREATTVNLIAFGAARRLRELSKENPKALTNALIKQLVDPSPLIRRMAVRGLGEMVISNRRAKEEHREMKVPQILEQLVDDPDPAMRIEVKTAIQRIQ